jgi:hypothetical protein
MRFLLPAPLFVFILTIELSAQTSINLAYQRDPDFSLIGPTKPFQIVTSLPSTCTLSQTVFWSGATAGENIYSCTSTNTYTHEGGGSGGGSGTIDATTDVLAGDGAGNAIDAGFAPAAILTLTGTQTITNKTVDGISPTIFGYLSSLTSSVQTQLNGKQSTLTLPLSISNGGTGTTSPGLVAGTNVTVTGSWPNQTITSTGGGGGAGSPLTVQTNGTSTGTASTILNVKAGSGTIASCTYDSGNSSNDCSFSYNTTLIPTHDQIHYNENYQTSTNGTTAMTTSSPNKVLSMYQAGECFDFITDTSNPISINIDGLGVVSLYLGDGSTTPPTGTVLAGYPFTACNDGTVFRLKSSSVNAIPSLEVPLLGLTIGTNVEAWAANLDTFAGKTPPAGAVVGTTDTQTLTNKTIASTEITGLPTFPAGTIVGTTDTQTLTNKSIAVSQLTGTYSPATINTASNCSSAASPAVCGSAAAGSVAIPTGTNPTLTVNTSAVTANSQIFLTSDDSLGTKLSVTCNSTLASIVAGIAVTARVTATSFTISFSGLLSTNALCLSYAIIN